MKFEDFSKADKNLMVDFFCADNKISKGAEKLLRYIVFFPGRFFPRMEKVAEELGVSRQTIYTWTNELEKKGVFLGNDKTSRSAKKE